MTFGWPQVVIFAWTMMSFGADFMRPLKTGQERWSVVCGSLVIQGFYLWVLWCGGFFG